MSCQILEYSVWQVESQKVMRRRATSLNWLIFEKPFHVGGVLRRSGQKSEVPLEEAVPGISLIIYNIRQGLWIVILHHHLDLWGSAMCIVCTNTTNQFINLLTRMHASKLGRSEQPTKRKSKGNQEG